MDTYGLFDTETLIDDNGKDKALIAEIQDRIEAREAVLKSRVAESSKGHGFMYDTSRITYDKDAPNKIKIYDLLDADNKISAYYKKTYRSQSHYDFFKYTARIIK